MEEPALPPKPLHRFFPKRLRGFEIRAPVLSANLAKLRVPLECRGVEHLLERGDPAVIHRRPVDKHPIVGVIIQKSVFIRPSREKIHVLLRPGQHFPDKFFIRRITIVIAQGEYPVEGVIRDVVDVRVYRVLALERPQRAFHHLRIEMGIIIDERALINVPAPRPAIPFHPVENEFLFAKPEGVEGNVEDLLKLFIFALKGAFRLVGRFLYRNEFLIRPFRKGEQISERLRALRRRNPLFGNDYVRLLAVLLVERLFPRFAVIAINGSLRAVKPDACRHFPAEIVKYSSALNLLFEVRRLFDGQAVGIGAIVGGVEYPARRGVKYVVLTGIEVMLSVLVYIRGISCFQRVDRKFVGILLLLMERIFHFRHSLHPMVFETVSHVSFIE